ncbi:MAG: acyltransferase [Calothrix sp. C42_A2020_038]|nr:acyltransferase [Calothrix sp. C42_A2020_038]
MYKIIENFFKSKFEGWIESYIENYFQTQLESRIQSYIRTNLELCLSQHINEGYFDQRIKEVKLMQHLVFGDVARLKLSPNCVVNNALFNLSSGNITIGDNVFFGHNVSVITGTHDYRKFGQERKENYPKEGNDVVVEEGVWIASNVTVIGPCKIGKHSVIAAGAVVKDDVSSYHIVGGIPAKTIKVIEYEGEM